MQAALTLLHNVSLGIINLMFVTSQATKNAKVIAILDTM